MESIRESRGGRLTPHPKSNPPPGQLHAPTPPEADSQMRLASQSYPPDASMQRSSMHRADARCDPPGQNPYSRVLDKLRPRQTSPLGKPSHRRARSERGRRLADRDTATTEDRCASISLPSLAHQNGKRTSPHERGFPLDVSISGCRIGRQHPRRLHHARSPHRCDPHPWANGVGSLPEKLSNPAATDSLRSSAEEKKNRGRSQPV